MTPPTATQPAQDAQQAVTTQEHPGRITRRWLAEAGAAFEANTAYRMAQNAVTQTPVDDVALRRDVVTQVDHTFSHLLDDWPVTHQKRSGRCWMFAGLNLIRAGAMKKMNVKEFEFSQNYPLFWDKLERSNYFLQSVIDTADRAAGDRLVDHLLTYPLDDGGQWSMFVSIVRKYGLVPKAFMPETASSSDTGRMNAHLCAKLREGARMLRELKAHGAPAEALRSRKLELLRVVHRILCIHLGTPPERLLWQWHDKDRNFHRDGELTPQEFAQRYCELPLDDYVCLVHDPRPGHPFQRTYTVERLGNVVGASPVLYVNVEMDVLKQAAVDTITQGEPVWFGCDVAAMMRRDKGVWDAQLFDYDALYDTTFGLDKASRLLYRQTCMTHAMLFTGVDLVDGSPRRWRVENSWGDEGGQKGFYIMNDSWFDEYLFEAAIRKDRLPAEVVEASKLEPIVLPPWDPMGALAG